MTNNDSGLTARGTPRIYKPRRSKEEIIADPNGDKSRDNVQIGGRISVELRTSFQDCVNKLNIQQGVALAEAVTDFLKKYNYPFSKTLDNE